MPHPQQKNLRTRLVESVDVATAEEAREFFRKGKWRGGDIQFKKGKRPKIFINPANYSSADVFKKLVFGESLHNLKNIEPALHKKLLEAALSSPEYRANAEAAYQTDIAAGRVEENDTFDKWHVRSRFDQVIGGFLQAQDEDIPTMMNWHRTSGMFGVPLKRELRQLAEQLGMGVDEVAALRKKIGLAQ